MACICSSVGAGLLRHAFVVQVLISNYIVEFTGRHEHADDFTWWGCLSGIHQCVFTEAQLGRPARQAKKLKLCPCRMDEAYFFEDWREAADTAGATV